MERIEGLSEIDLSECVATSCICVKSYLTGGKTLNK